MLKICTKCKQEKPLTDFVYRDKPRGIRVSACKVCTRAMVNRHYKNHPKDYLKRNKRRKKDLRELMLKIKDRPCADCGGSFHFSVMDFDHVDGQKLFSLGAYSRIGSIKKIVRELVKCDVVCANCHRLRTWKRMTGEIE